MVPPNLRALAAFVPALVNVCLVATDDTRDPVGTDLEVVVRFTSRDVKVEEPGTVLVPRRMTWTSCAT